MRLDRDVGDSAHGLYHERPESQVGDEVAVHDIDLDPIRARGHGLSYLVAQPRDVGRKDRGNDLDLRHRPAAASWSISHCAPAIIPEGTSPRFAFATASALPAPVASTITRRAPRRVESVSVTR